MSPLINHGFNLPEKFDMYSVLDWQRNIDKPDDYQLCFIKTIKGHIYEKCYWAEAQDMWFVKPLNLGDGHIVMPLDLGDGYLPDDQVSEWCKDERKLETIKE